MAVCYLSLGSNLGDRAEHLAQALERLSAHPQVTLQAVSDVYETAPAETDDEQPDYLNLVAAIETDLAPEALLDLALAIEADLGRVRPYYHAPRTIDIDLLACGGIMVRSPRLVLPHPRMLQRQFVLVPLADLAPDLRLGGNPPVKELADRHSAGLRRAGRLEDLRQS